MLRFAIPIFLGFAGVQAQGACNQDNCFRAVGGTRFLRPTKADCSSFLATTVTPKASTVTVLVIATDAPIAARDITKDVTSTTQKTFPTYAAACKDAGRYSSACSCIGVNPFTVTAATPSPVTVTITEFAVVITELSLPQQSSMAVEVVSTSLDSARLSSTTPSAVIGTATSTVADSTVVSSPSAVIGTAVSTKLSSFTSVPVQVAPALNSTKAAAVSTSSIPSVAVVTGLSGPIVTGNAVIRPVEESTALFANATSMSSSSVLPVSSSTPVNTAILATNETVLAGPTNQTVRAAATNQTILSVPANETIRSPYEAIRPTNDTTRAAVTNQTILAVPANETLRATNQTTLATNDITRAAATNQTILAVPTNETIRATNETIRATNLTNLATNEITRAAVTNQTILSVPANETLRATNQTKLEVANDDVATSSSSASIRASSIPPFHNVTTTAIVVPATDINRDISTNVDVQVAKTASQASTAVSQPSTLSTVVTQPSLAASPASTARISAASTSTASAAAAATALTNNDVTNTGSANTSPAFQCADEFTLTSYSASSNTLSFGGVGLDPWGSGGHVVSVNTSIGGRAAFALLADGSLAPAEDSSLILNVDSGSALSLAWLDTASDIAAHGARWARLTCSVSSTGALACADGNVPWLFQVCGRQTQGAVLAGTAVARGCDQVQFMAVCQ